jgi:hypothetical protein
LVLPPEIATVDKFGGFCRKKPLHASDQIFLSGLCCLFATFLTLTIEKNNNLLEED